MGFDEDNMKRGDDTMGCAVVAVVRLGVRPISDQDAHKRACTNLSIVGGYKYEGVAPDFMEMVDFRQQAVEKLIGGFARRKRERGCAVVEVAGGAVELVPPVFGDTSSNTHSLQMGHQGPVQAFHLSVVRRNVWGSTPYADA